MQCGYCTPGWLTATAALLARVPHPSDERIAAELTNICRCCTYPRIQRAVHRAAELLEDPEQLAAGARRGCVPGARRGPGRYRSCRGIWPGTGLSRSRRPCRMAC